MNRRVAVLVILCSLVVGGLVLDRSTDDDVVVAETPGVDATVFPVAGEPSDLASTWFCAGGTADEEAFADHVIAVLNPTESAMRVSITAFAGTVAPPSVTADVDGEGETTETTETTEATETTETTEAAPDRSREPVVRELEIAPRTRRRLALSELVSAPVASALVESSSGGLVVEHEVSSIHGYDAKPCATSASDQWHFAWGTTEREARELLVLFNPFPDDAILDGRFSTEDGVREPVRFDGLVVPGRSTLAVDLGDDVTRRAEVAASITARTGRVVVDRIVRVNEEGGVRGLTVQLGVPRPQLMWIYPDGFTSEDVQETYVVYNPGDDVAEVELAFVLDDPEIHGIPEPVDLSLAPGAHAVVDVAAEGRVPAGLGHAAVVRSLNSVPVVAERVLASSVPDRAGLTVTTGSPVSSSEWFFAAGAVSDRFDEVLLVYNPDPVVLTEIDVFAVVNGQAVPVSGHQDVVVEAGERLAIRLGQEIRRDDLAVFVRSSEPVIVERGLYRVGEDARGASTSIGVPGSSGLRIPQDPLEVEAGTEVDDELDEAPTDEDDEPPVAPDDVDLPEPDETIVIDDPDAEAEDRDGQQTTTTSDGVPDTAPDDG